jgi:hypothetical protein
MKQMIQAQGKGPVASINIQILNTITLFRAISGNTWGSWPCEIIGYAHIKAGSAVHISVFYHKSKYTCTRSKTIHKSSAKAIC